MAKNKLLGLILIFTTSACHHSSFLRHSDNHTHHNEELNEEMTEDHWIERDEYSSERGPSSEVNKPGGLILNGPLKVKEKVSDFILPSEKRSIVFPGDSGSKPTYRADMKGKEIAITIDDGPDPKYNSVVLKTLREHGVKAMFFLVGHRIIAHPELVKNILKEGHVIANHSWTHPNMQKKDIVSTHSVCPLDLSKKTRENGSHADLTANEEIDCTQMLLEKIVSELNTEEQAQGRPGSYRVQPYFRFPFGAGANNEKYQKLLEDRKMSNFHWKMSAKDSETQDPNVSLNTAVAMLDSKKFESGMLLMHETHIAGVKALPSLLEELHERQYKTVYYESNE